MSITYTIKTKWNSLPINHRPVQITLSSIPSTNGILINIEAPLFSDPPSPTSEPGPTDKLWNYEVVEIMLLNSKTNHYLELEFSPSGHYLVLFLNGRRNIVKHLLPLNYTVTCTNDSWSGIADIPFDYFPKNIDRINCYAIYGSNEDRVYEALYPVPLNKYSEPDFHRLEYFNNIDFKLLMINNHVNDQSESKIWTENLS